MAINSFQIEKEKDKAFRFLYHLANDTPLLTSLFDKGGDTRASLIKNDIFNNDKFDFTIRNSKSYKGQLATGVIIESIQALKSGYDKVIFMTLREFLLFHKDSIVKYFEDTLNTEYGLDIQYKKEITPHLEAYIKALKEL